MLPWYPVRPKSIGLFFPLSLASNIYPCFAVLHLKTLVYTPDATESIAHCECVFDFAFSRLPTWFVFFV